MGAVDGRLDAAGKVDMVILEHYHVVEADAMVGAATTVHSIFFEKTHVGSGFAGVEQTGVEAVEHLHHVVGLRGYTAETLHKIEGGTFGGKDYTRSPLDDHEDIPFSN